MFFLLLACATEAEDSSASSADSACVVAGDRPAGWGELSHDNASDPDYDHVFDRASVMRVDLAVSQDDYAAAFAELAELLGTEFGAGGGGPGGGGPPDNGVDPREAMDACLGLTEGDACSVAADGVETEGTCDAAGPQGELMCTPAGGGGGGGANLDFTGSDPSYFQAAVTVDDETWCSVGMRFKGNSTLSSAWSEGVEKLPFRLDFDRFEDEHPEIDDQRFYGFSDLSFGNNYSDATYIRDVMSSVILEDRGVPAARNRFAAVYLDTGDGPVYLGLYTLNEDPSDALPDRLWGTHDGELYEADGTCANLACYDADSFTAKLHDGDGAEVQALVAALAADRSDATAWRAGLEGTVDVPGFLKWLAVNSAIENWDTYGVMAHNYYLYALPEAGGRLQWIPWDHNMALADGMMGSDDPLLADVTDDWPLIRLTLDDEEYASIYREELADALTGAYATETFEATAEQYRTLLEPYVVGADGERAESTFVGSEATWTSAYETLYSHAQSRRETVEEALRR